jgi:hypothetical protein
MNQAFLVNTVRWNGREPLLPKILQLQGAVWINHPTAVAMMKTLHRFANFVVLGISFSLTHSLHTGLPLLATEMPEFGFDNAFSYAKPQIDDGQLQG